MSLIVSIDQALSNALACPHYFVRKYMPQMSPFQPSPDSLAGWWFFTSDGQVLSIEQGARLPFGQFQELPIAAELLVQAEYFGDYEAEPCYRLELEGQPDIGLGDWVALRDLMSQTPQGLFMMAGRAIQHQTFLKTHKYCGQCGSPLERVNWELAMQCHACGFRAYPRLSPSIIVAVSRGDELLLACHRRHQHSEPRLYTVLAGFAEPGETLEQCVAREVFEEVGLKVRNIRYFGNQPWPFPHSMMIAFQAEYDCGDINLDRRELVDANWFKPDNFPALPSDGTIARKLIRAFVEKPL
jgi:NAD+ diphosphatase